MTAPSGPRTRTATPALRPMDRSRGPRAESLRRAGQAERRPCPGEARVKRSTLRRRIERRIGPGNSWRPGPPRRRSATVPNRGTSNATALMSRAAPAGARAGSSSEGDERNVFRSRRLARQGLLVHGARRRKAGEAYWNSRRRATWTRPQHGALRRWPAHAGGTPPAAGGVEQGPLERQAPAWWCSSDSQAGRGANTLWSSRAKRQAGGRYLLSREEPLSRLRRKAPRCTPVGRLIIAVDIYADVRERVQNRLRVVAGCSL